MADKFVEDILSEQQRIANLIVQLKSEIKTVHDSVSDKEVSIQELAGKLDVLKQVHDFYTKGAIQAEAPQQPQLEQVQPESAQPEPQSVFTPEQQNQEKTQ